jgi:hypothetical protein
MDQFPLHCAILKGLKSRPADWVAKINISGFDEEGFDNILEESDQYHQMICYLLKKKPFYKHFMCWLDEVYTNIEPLAEDAEYTQEDYDYTIITSDHNVSCILLNIEQKQGPVTRYLISLDKYPLPDEIMEGIHENQVSRDYTVNLDSPSGLVEILLPSTEMSEDIRTDFIEWMQVVTHSNAGTALLPSSNPVYDFLIFLPQTPETISPQHQSPVVNMLLSYGASIVSPKQSASSLNPKDISEFTTFAQQSPQIGTNQTQSLSPVVAAPRKIRTRRMPTDHVEPLRRSTRSRKSSA